MKRPTIPLQSIGYAVERRFDLPEWWDEPEDYERKSWGKGERSYTRIVYSKDIIDFIREGW